MKATWDKHRIVIAIGALALLAILLASCVREDVVSQNVWAFGVPLGLSLIHISYFQKGHQECSCIQNSRYTCSLFLGRHFRLGSWAPEGFSLCTLKAPCILGPAEIRYPGRICSLRNRNRVLDSVSPLGRIFPTQFCRNAIRMD